MSNTKEERDAKSKDRRTIRLRSSTVGRGSPDQYGLTAATRRPGDGGRFNHSTQKWLDLIEQAASEPGEWFNRRFYYGDPPPQHNSFNNIAGYLTKQGQSNGKIKDTDLLVRIRELVDLYKVQFDARYTFTPVRSDDRTKGEWMHMVFVKADRTGLAVKDRDAFAVNGD